MTKNKEEKIIINGKKYILSKEKEKEKEIPKANTISQTSLIKRLIWTKRKRKELLQLDKELKIITNNYKQKEKRYNLLKNNYDKKIKELAKIERVILKNNFLIFLKRLLGMNREKALIFDSDGVLSTTISILPEENTFKYKNFEYLVDRTNTLTKIIIRRLLEKETYYFYNINETTPLQLKYELSTNALSPKEFYTLMNTQQLVNLNKSGGAFTDLFKDPKKLLVIAGIGVIVYIILSGGLV